MLAAKVALRLLLLCRGDEPEPLKRLKREMGVALHEEDYAAAGMPSAAAAGSYCHALRSQGAGNLQDTLQSTGAIAHDLCKCAARIRDHPFMRMHMRILEHRRNKREDAAKTMEEELEQMITEQSGSPDRE